MYGLADGNGAAAQRLYQERFERRCPDRKTFEATDRRLREHGTMKPNTRDWRRPRRTRTPQLEEAILHSVSVADFPARRHFCEWFIQQCVNPNFSATVLFTDEASFQRDQIVNFHNQHIWVAVNHHATVEAVIDKDFLSMFGPVLLATIW